MNAIISCSDLKLVVALISVLDSVSGNTRGLLYDHILWTCFNAKSMLPFYPPLLTLYSITLVSFNESSNPLANATDVEISLRLTSNSSHKT